VRLASACQFKFDQVTGNLRGPNLSLSPCLISAAATASLNRLPSSNVTVRGHGLHLADASVTGSGGPARNLTVTESESGLSTAEEKGKKNIASPHRNRRLF
jgi:hypothetical protein